jgi:dTDP-4-dehydrorhamnose reductase
MRILLIGCNGQLGSELYFKLKMLGELVAVNREQLDLENPNQIRMFVDRIKPGIIINAAAYTDVDRSEVEQDLCYQINVIAPQIFAECASHLKIPLIHYSTDYVFDGLKASAYLESDLTNPQSFYGKTKCEGEEKVRLYNKHIILRTSWVFSKYGENFLKTILKHIQNKDSLNIINDQIGAPTSTSTLSDVTYEMVKLILESKNFKYFGTFHAANSGETSWFDYAKFIASEAIKLGVKVRCPPSRIQPISSSAYSAAARRPLNSKLNCEKLKKTFMLELPNWQDEVKKVLRELIKI